MFAFGVDIYAPTSAATGNGCNVAFCVRSTFDISFLSGGRLLDTVTIMPDNNARDVIGFSSATGFDAIRVRETAGSNDTGMFGNCVTPTTQLVPVPLPAGIGLLGLGLLGFGWMSRCNRAAA